MIEHCGHAEARLCTHPEHQAFGLGHIRGPRRVAAEYEALVALPAEFIAPDSAPVLDQGSTPWCEPFTAATGRRLTQPPVGQDGFDRADLAALSGASPNGTTTAAIEKVLLSPGASCNSGPGSGHRWPVASCPNISTLAGIKSAVYSPANGYFVGYATNWYESWFSPVNGVLPKPDYVAGGHIFRVKGFSDSRGQLYCQNSWGTGWSLGGFFWLPYVYLESPAEAYTQIAKPEYTPMPGTTITPVPNSSAARVLDTRIGRGLSGPFVLGVARTFGVTGAAVPAGAVGVMGNLTVTQQSAPGYLAIGPVPTNAPTNSTLNFPKGDDRANGVFVGLTADGKVSVTFISSTPGATAHVIFDVTGFVTP